MLFFCVLMENLGISPSGCPLSSQNPNKSQSPTPPGESGNYNKKVIPTRRGERKYVGVRQRPSGRWVAEIKGSSQKLRLWLGTYDRAEDAAMAYDSAARFLRGRKAKTNFHFPPGMIPNSHHQICTFVRNNPRAYHILKHAIIMKNYHHHALVSSAPNNNNNIPRDGFGTLVEQTLVCCSTTITSDDVQQASSGSCGVSFGSSKVYSSVVVAPSFSASFSQEETS